MAKFENHELNQKRSSGWVDISLLRLNPANKRRDFGGMSVEMAQKICDPAHELTDEEKTEIRDLLAAQDPYNDQTMRWLVDRVMQLGVVSTIVGYWDSKDEVFYATAGNRRTCSFNIVNKVFGGDIRRVPIEHELSKDPKKIVLRQLVENSGRKGYSDMEDAEAISDALAVGLTKEEIAAAKGISLDTIAERLNLLVFDPTAREILKDETLIAPTTAVKIAKEAQAQNGNIMTASAEASKVVVQLGKQAKERGKRVTASELKQAKRQEIAAQAQADPELQAQLADRRSEATIVIDAALQAGLKDDSVLPRQVKLLLDGADPKTLKSIIRVLLTDQGVPLDAIEQVAKNLERQVG